MGLSSCAFQPNRATREVPTVKYNWTDEAQEYLAANYAIMRPGDIARHLGCSTRAVYNKASRLGLRRPGAKPKPPKPKPLPHKIPPAVQARLQYAPRLPVDVLLQGRYVQNWGWDTHWLYIAALLVQVGKVEPRC